MVGFDAYAFSFVDVGLLLALDRLFVAYCLFCVVVFVLLCGLIVLFALDVCLRGLVFILLLDLIVIVCLFCSCRVVV